MQLGREVSGEVAADVVEGLAEVLGVGDSVVMLVRGSHPESRHVAFLVLSDSKILACGGPGSGPEVMLWSLDEFEGIAVVTAKTLSLRRWDGSTIVVGCLHSRAEDEKGFLAALEAGIRAQPSFDAKFHEIGERRVHAVGHRFPDDSGRITARRLHPFLEDDEEVLFACAFMANSGIDGDALALTNFRVLVYRSDAFGQALATSNRYSNLAAWLFKGSQLQLTDQIGNRVVLGRLRHAKQDLATVQNILRTCMQTDPAQQGTTTAEQEYATHYNLHLESPGPAVIDVIKACRAHTGLGLRQAKKMVDACPVVVLRHAPAHEAHALHRALIALGANASLTASDDVATPETVPSDRDAGAVDRDDSIDSHDDDQSILDPAGSPLLPLPESAMSLDGEAIADAAFAAWERDDFALAEELWLQA